MVAVVREDDSPVEEPLRVAVLADRLGYREVWAGEGPTWDPFVLAARLPAAVDPDLLAFAQVLGSIAGYLTVPGYSEVFVEAGLDEVVLVPATAGDPAGEGTLTALRPG
ncbi:hypothetical protein [Streptomyces sp. SID13726]|uniref:hypothetical protein n=1 Tax=Streptomyces sp. SID13726 TaxID=2706058 RepID=UPI0013BA0759|nr:hypothetical protein [Streptomyces sp. SID13726]